MNEATTALTLAESQSAEINKNRDEIRRLLGVAQDDVRRKTKVKIWRQNFEIYVRNLRITRPRPGQV